MVVVGVLALQGGFREHLDLLQAASRSSAVKGADIRPTAVRTETDLEQCDALIIPGGESTTMALIAERTGLLEPLRQFVHDPAKAIWGTCAGLILLSDEIVEGSAKKGGQKSLGGMPIRVVRSESKRSYEVVQSISADYAQINGVAKMSRLKSTCSSTT